MNNNSLVHSMFLEIIVLGGKYKKVEINLNSYISINILQYAQPADVHSNKPSNCKCKLDTGKAKAL